MKPISFLPNGVRSLLDLQRTRANMNLREHSFPLGILKFIPKIEPARQRGLVHCRRNLDGQKRQVATLAMQVANHSAIARVGWRAFIGFWRHGHGCLLVTRVTNIFARNAAYINKMMCIYIYINTNI